MERQLLQPNVRKDISILNELLADEFFEYGSSGTVWSKTDATNNGGMNTPKMTLYDFSIHNLSEDVVLATYRVKDETRNRETLRSSIWKKISGNWQMVFHQGTVMPTL
nr:DUF4440 domain-containing protein [Salirhabdus salicampi]